MGTLKIINKLKAKNPTLKNSQIKLIFHLIIENITSSLLKNNSVEIRGLGRFSIKDIKEKKSARNPKTGELIYVPAKKKIAFKMSKHLKEEIN